MCEGIIFVAEMPDVELDATGATLSYTSGGTLYQRRYGRAMWRKFLECETRRLNQFDFAERAERAIVEMRRVEH